MHLSFFTASACVAGNQLLFHKVKKFLYLPAHFYLNLFTSDLHSQIKDFAYFLDNLPVVSVRTGVQCAAYSERTCACNINGYTRADLYMCT